MATLIENYNEEIERDIREYIESYIQREEWIGRKEDLEEHLIMNLLGEDLFDFSVDSGTVTRKFIEEDWEYFDVLIRYSILSQYIRLVLDDLGNSGYFGNDKENL